jgi:hypothetical protein
MLVGVALFLSGELQLVVRKLVEFVGMKVETSPTFSVTSEKSSFKACTFRKCCKFGVLCNFEESRASEDFILLLRLL